MGRDREAPKAQVYNSGDDRDIAIESTYTLSDSILAFMGGRPKNTLAAIYEHLPAIAEAYLHEDRGQERFDDHFQRWCVRHFGRVPEPCARMLLRQEVARRIDFKDGGTKRPSAGLYASWDEQKRWEAAERQQPALRPVGSHLERLEGICRVMGVELGPGPQPMPSAYVERPSADAEYERLQRLREQAARIVADDPAPARLPYRDPE